jgi:hypothetical protein
LKVGYDSTGTAAAANIASAATATPGNNQIVDFGYTSYDSKVAGAYCCKYMAAILNTVGIGEQRCGATCSEVFTIWSR